MAATQWIPVSPDIPEDDSAESASGAQQMWRPSRAGTVLQQSVDAPVFAELADQWRSAGRMVPGQTDTEWAELVGRIPRLTGV
ncbi:hypothetical protein SAMN05216251_101545 [Actinacidiphila alni]|uniref:Uncharacterized protein n=1 Tax=Actinacidiphila alni TaxID=380248 RepID=A0A1I1XUD8_9ACTN|nr:hypothetical protein [Actinacidiphila alni]SFE10975.1 hypothetical protein SAMN05216251_101545 [Actinacidiphila alni]